MSQTSHPIFYLFVRLLQFTDLPQYITKQSFNFDNVLFKSIGLFIFMLLLSLFLALSLLLNKLLYLIFVAFDERSYLLYVLSGFERDGLVLLYLFDVEERKIRFFSILFFVGATDGPLELVKHPNKLSD